MDPKHAVQKACKEAARSQGGTEMSGADGRVKSENPKVMNSVGNVDDSDKNMPTDGLGRTQGEFQDR